MIRTVFKWQDGTVMVFDERGEQIPKYQGPYEKVKGIVLRDAPPDAVFCHGFWSEADIKIVRREEW